jgi:hypothetical protein
MLFKYLQAILFTILQVKLHCVGVDDNVEGNGYLEGRSYSKHRTKFADGYFSHHVFDFLSFYLYYLHIRYKLLCDNVLFQNSVKRIVTIDSVLLSCFEMQIKHFNIDAKLANTNSVLSHHSVVADIEQVHCMAGDLSLWDSNDAIATKIVRC